MFLSSAKVAMLAASVCVFVGACATQLPKDEFIAHPHKIDQRLESASIEEYIIALPVYYSEGGDEYYRERVMQARESFPENKNKNRDYLFIKGSGCDGDQIVILNREEKTLKILTHLWEPWHNNNGESDPWHDDTKTYGQIIMRRVPGGWIRSHGPIIPHSKLKEHIP